MKKHILLTAFFFLFSLTSFAATITVSHVNDEYSDNDNCSLREAITNANIDASFFDECAFTGTYGDDTITLEDGNTYSLQILGSNETLNISGDLDITDNLTITSLGSSYIDASALYTGAAPDRILDSISLNNNITLSNIALQYGWLEMGTTNEGGAAIRINSGTLTLNYCDLLNNTVHSNSSGHINGGIITFLAATTDSHLIMSNSDLTSNTVSIDPSSTARVVGGLIYLNGIGTSSITDTNFTSNTITSNGRLSGGLLSISSLGDTDITNTTFSQNTVTTNNLGTNNKGGLLDISETNLTISKSSFLNNEFISTSATISGNLYFTSNAGKILTISNSTIANNQISNSTLSATGGALHIAGTNPVVQISFSTLVNNAAKSLGGAISMANSAGSVTLKSNIIANNTVTDSGASGPNCYSSSVAPTSADYNVIEDTTDCNFTTQTHDVTGSDPTLAVTATYLGGATDVYSFTTSIAKNLDPLCLAADGTTTIDTDQRGAPRSDGSCDAGAYEYSTFCQADVDGDDYGSNCGAAYQDGYTPTTLDCDDNDADINPAATEICDTIDNNCDGSTDEGFAELDDECTVGVGQCLAEGVKVCNSAGDDLECNATPGTASAELCGDTIDNDCDGSTDEGFENLGTTCSEGVGACQNTGTYQCSVDALSLDCNATPGTASAEICGDTIDNDCDGETNEGFAELGEECSEGVGACQNTGTYQCSVDALSLDCNATPGTASAEICGDTIDNDCDGSTDEDCATSGDDDDTSGDDDDDGTTDTDGDGIADSTDNCPATSNVDQIDSDDDGIGDECDNAETTSSSGGCQLATTANSKDSGLIWIWAVALGWLSMRRRKTVTEI